MIDLKVVEVTFLFLLRSVLSTSAITNIFSGITKVASSLITEFCSNRLPSNSPAVLFNLTIHGGHIGAARLLPDPYPYRCVNTRQGLRQHIILIGPVTLSDHWSLVIQSTINGWALFGGVVNHYRSRLSLEMIFKNTYHFFSKDCMKIVFFKNTTYSLVFWELMTLRDNV